MKKTLEYADSKFYLETFSAVLILGDDKVRIDGTKISFLQKLKRIEYKCNDFTFNGVSIEFVIAEKTLALLNELDRPYKHLVDIYSFSRLEEGIIDYDELRRIINLINDEENIIRKQLGFPELVLKNEISDKKVFSGKEIIPTLQSKYLLSKEELIDSVNKWLKKVL